MKRRKKFFKEHGLQYNEKEEVVVMPHTSDIKFTENGITWGGIEWTDLNEDSKRKVALGIYNTFYK